MGEPVQKKHAGMAVTGAAAMVAMVVLLWIGSWVRGGGGGGGGGGVPDQQRFLPGNDW